MQPKEPLLTSVVLVIFNFMRNKPDKIEPKHNHTHICIHMPGVSAYIEQMSEQERIVMAIAIEHLGTSFDITKSIGYKEWCKNTFVDK
jgi:hypothetical protein